jgi:holo-[acyl-carrier protein] synthase
MAAGTGTDIVAVGRIRALIDLRGMMFLQRWFTADEIACCKAKAKPYLHFAARLAAKEAVLKALPIPWDGPIPWRSIEISRTEQGRPTVRLSGGILDAATRAGVGVISVSLSHCEEYAVAVAVADLARDRSTDVDAGRRVG